MWTPGWTPHHENLRAGRDAGGEFSFPLKCCSKLPVPECTAEGLWALWKGVRKASRGTRDECVYQINKGTF